MSSNKNYTLDVYFDYVCSPSRAFVCLLEENEIKFNIKEVLLIKEDNKKDFYKNNINEFCYLPGMVLNDDLNTQNFILYESSACMKFACRYFNLPENWYNSQNIKREALINKYLDWQAGSSKKTLQANYFNEKVVNLFKKHGINKSKIASVDNPKEKLDELMKYYNNIFSKQKFIIDNEISIADLVFYSDLLTLILFEDSFDVKKYKHVDDYFSNRVGSLKGVGKVRSILIDKLKEYGFELQ